MTLGTGDRWSVDHLVIDQDAVPTLVEVKRGDNTELRREVVGQMLDYAAHAHLVSVGKMSATFMKQPNAYERLCKLLDDPEPDVDKFWEDVAENLQDRTIRLLFVADAIPDELAHIVEFLNEKMPDIQVLAVEIKQFPGETTQTLVPRVIGRLAKPERSAPGGGPRPKLARDLLLNALPSDVARDAAMRLFEVADECGARVEGKKRSISIRMRCSAWEHTQPITVAWLFEPGASGPVPPGGQGFTFGTAVLGYHQMPEGELPATLEQWANQFRDDTFTEEAEGSGGTAWTVTYENAAQHIDLLADRLHDILTKLKNL